MENKKTNVEKSNDFWDNFIVERNSVLEKLDKDDLLKFEKELNKKINTELNNRKVPGYFDWKLILNERIKFYIIVSNRNIGKSYSSRELMEEYAERGEEFLFIRTLKTELDAVLPTFMSWFNKKGWKFKKGDGRIYDNDDNTIGWVRSLSQAYANKSAEFDNVKIIVYDEFISFKTIKEQFEKLLTYIITAQRQKEDFKVLLMANYLDGENDILNSLGFSIIEKGGIHFNWLTGALLWHIPSGVFNEFKQDDNIGYRSSLTSKESYTANYGGSFTNTSLKNVMNQSFINSKKIEPVIILSEPKFTCLISKRLLSGELVMDLIIGDEITKYDCPKVSNTYNWVLRYSDINYVDADFYTTLINLWYGDEIKTNGDIKLRNNINLFFSNLLSKQNNKGMVYEL